MPLFSCCLCGEKAKREDSYKIKPEFHPLSLETEAQKEVTAEFRSSDDGGPPAPFTSTHYPAAEEEPPLQLVAGRLAKHLLERQPSKSKRLQSASFGGVTGQRWVSNLDGSTIESSGYNGSTASAGLLLQEVKPLYDPIAGPSNSRLAGTFASLTSQGIIPHSTGGGHHSSSMNFARSVNRLSTINTSGAFSRRASLLDLDIAKASLQLALGSSLLRGSIAGAVSTYGAPPEPWMLHNVLRQTAVPSVPTGAAHSVPYMLPSGPFGQAGHAPSSLPTTSSLMATIAAGLGQNPSIAGRQSCDRENSRPSYGQINVQSPAATHAQHALHPQHTAYPVPLFSRTVCDRVEGLPAPLVVLVLRSAGAAAGASDGVSGAGGTGAGARGMRGLSRSEEREQSGAMGRKAILAGSGNADVGDDGDGYVGWPTPAPSGPVVASMKLDMPTPQQVEAKRRISTASHGSRPMSQRQQSQPSQPFQIGDSEGEVRQRAYACLASALEEASGRQVALVHAWHNGAAGSLLMSAVNIAAANRAPNAATGGVEGSESQQFQCDINDASAAAAAASAEGGELSAVLWSLRELFDQDPCLPLLARDLLRQAAIRPEHVPPLTHSLVPSAYSNLLGGRDPYSVVTLAAGANGSVAAPSAGPSGVNCIRQASPGASMLQAAVSLGQVRVHVCVFQTGPSDTAASALSTVETTGSGGSGPASVRHTGWLPAIVLEWPQAAACSGPMPVPLPPTTVGGAPSSTFNATMLVSPMARGSIPASQQRSLYCDPERPNSSTVMTLEGPGPTPISLGQPSAIGFTRQFAVDLPTPSPQLILPNVMPSLSLGMASLSGTMARGQVAIESGLPQATAVPCAPDPAGGAFGSPASASRVDDHSPVIGPELAPLAGAELLYVIQTWQRHHLLLASVPYAITLFDCGGRVLQQNQGSVDFMGEITGDPMEQHQTIAATAVAAAGAAPNMGMNLEQRTSVTFGHKASTEVSDRGCLGSFGMSFSSGQALMDISEVDVLSVLFCLCPDLLDEMLEEVICGNMWRGIVQVPRVMRPCIRAAQRWGAAAKASVAQGSPGPAAAAAAADVAAARAGSGSAFAGDTAGAMADTRGDSIGAGPGGAPKPLSTNAATPMGMNVAGATSTGASGLRNLQSSPHDSFTSSTNTVEAAAAANMAGAVDGTFGALQHNRSFNSGRPSINVASPLRRLATSLAISGIATDLKRPGGFGGSAGGGDGNGADVNDGSRTGLQRPETKRRPPARSYSLRGLMRPMVNNHSTHYARSSNRGGMHRLALGDSCSSNAAASPAEQPGSLGMPAAAAVPPPTPPRSRRPPTRVRERSSLGEPRGFHSFTAEHSNGLLPQRHFSEQSMSSLDPQGPDNAGNSKTHVQLAKRAAPPLSPAFGAAAKPRSSVLAFAERLRSGRAPGTSSSSTSNNSSLSGTFPVARAAPRRLRSSLSLATGPDGPLPALQGSPFTAHCALDLVMQSEEIASSEDKVEAPEHEMETDQHLGSAPVQRRAEATKTHADLTQVSSPAVMTPAALSGLQHGGGTGAGGDSDGDDSTAVSATPVDLGQMSWEAEANSTEAEKRFSCLAKGVGTTGGWNGHLPRKGFVASHAVDVTAAPSNSGDSPRFSEAPVLPLNAAPAIPPPLLSLSEQRQIRMMSDPVRHPVLPGESLIAEPCDCDATASDADAVAVALAAAACATAPQPYGSEGEDTFDASTAPMDALIEGNEDEGVSHNGSSLGGQGRPAHSVPIRRLEANGNAAAQDIGPAEYPAPSATGGRNHSANGAGQLTGGSNGHARGSVRRQQHALKRPLSRSSTRTYLMTAIPTSTLNVLGRVHSMRQMEYEAPGGEEDAVAAEEKNRIGGGGGNLLRASTTTAGLGRRTRIPTVVRSKSQSLNVTAAEPRMAVPRIFSFMRSASRRMLQQMQGQQGHAAGVSAAGEDFATQLTSIFPQRRHTFELAPLDGSGDGSGSVGARGAALRTSHSPRLSSDYYAPPRISPHTRLGLEPAYPQSLMAPSVSSAARTGEAVAGPCSNAPEGLLLKGSQESMALTPTQSLVAAAIVSAMPSSSGDDAGTSAPITGAEAVANSAASPTAVDEHISPSLPTALQLPQLSRLRASEDCVDAGCGVRMMSPRDMSPAEMARRVGMAWHEVAATSFTDPVTGARVVALVQNDVSEKVETEMQLTELMEVEHRLLEQIFPRHVLEHIAMQNISGATAQHSQANGGGRSRQRRMSQFDLLKSQDCSQLAHHHEQITVLFCDVKGFTAMCSSVEPAVVMSFLNMLYTQFDSLLHVHDVYKVETIGDCYMVAGGLVRRGPDGVAALLEPGEVDPDHARKVVRFAKDLLDVVREMRMPNGQPLQVRVGIHSGPAMSGVVGTKMPRFCLFGDTINTASRCESTCPPSSIHATTVVRDLVPEELWVATGGVMAKGKGMMRTFLLGPSDPGGNVPGPADDGAVSDLCSSRPVGLGVGIGSGFVSPRAPHTAGTGGIAVTALPSILGGGSGAAPDVAAGAPIAAAALSNTGPSPPAAASRHSALLRLGSGVRRNNSLRAITTTSAAVAAAAAAAAAAGGISSAGPGNIAAAAAIAAAGGGGSGSSGPESPSGRVISGAAVCSSPGPPHMATTSGYLRLPSTVLSSSPAETVTTSTLVRTFAPAGELPYVAPVVDSSRGVVAATSTNSIYPDADSLALAHDLRVLTVIAAGRRLGSDGAAVQHVGDAGVSMSPGPRIGSSQNAGMSLFAAQSTRTELGPDFVSSSAVVPGSGLLFDSGIGVTATEPAIQAGALPPITCPVVNEHEPQDLGENLRAPAGSRAGGSGSASASR